MREPADLEGREREETYANGDQGVRRVREKNHEIKGGGGRFREAPRSFRKNLEEKLHSASNALRALDKGEGE